jgi:hypothetical protein
MTITFLCTKCHCQYLCIKRIPIPLSGHPDIRELKEVKPVDILRILPLFQWKFRILFL